MGPRNYLTLKNGDSWLLPSPVSGLQLTGEDKEGKMRQWHGCPSMTMRLSEGSMMTRTAVLVTGYWTGLFVHRGIGGAYGMLCLGA